MGDSRSVFVPGALHLPWQLIIRRFGVEPQDLFEDQLRDSDTRSVRRASGLVLVGDPGAIGRIAEMDRGGLEICILSLVSPGIQAVPSVSEAIALSRRANDYLAEHIAKYPKRLKGFAALPLQDPLAGSPWGFAVAELIVRRK
jgi:predicted TIM-barrel fold metal-dependent hydrolase